MPSMLDTVLDQFLQEHLCYIANAAYQGLKITSELSTRELNLLASIWVKGGHASRLGAT